MPEECSISSRPFAVTVPENLVRPKPETIGTRVPGGGSRASAASSTRPSGTDALLREVRGWVADRTAQGTLTVTVAGMRQIFRAPLQAVSRTLISKPGPLPAGTTTGMVTCPSYTK